MEKATVQNVIKEVVRPSFVMEGGHSENPDTSGDQMMTTPQLRFTSWSDSQFR